MTYLAVGSEYQRLPIQNSLAHAVLNAPKLFHTTPILKNPHRLKINEFNIIFFKHRYKVFTSAQPAYQFRPLAAIAVQLLSPSRFNNHKSLI